MKRWLNRSAIGSLVFLVALYLVLFNRFGPEKGAWACLEIAPTWTNVRH